MTAKFRLRRIGCAPSISSVKDVLDINSDITIIGRNKLSADLYLDSKTTTGLISRMHARIIRNKKDGKQQYELRDTSLNGTYVNDRKISGSVILNNGDLIAFGHKKGAILEPGAFAPQKDSEFLFKFEKVHYATEEKDFSCCPLPLYADVHKVNDGKTTIRPLPKCSNNFQDDRMMEIGLGDSLPSHLQGPGGLNQTMQTPSDVELRSLVNAVISKSENESDEEFSFSTTPIRPSCYAASTTLGTIGALSEKQLIKPRRASDESQEKLTGAKKRKQNLQKENRKRPRSDDGVTYRHDSCASMDCCHPSDPTNTWVQCDDCDQWFHLKCAGLSNRDASKESTSFHCGCS